MQKMEVVQGNLASAKPRLDCRPVPGGDPGHKSATLQHLEYTLPVAGMACLLSRFAGGPLPHNEESATKQPIQIVQSKTSDGRASYPHGVPLGAVAHQDAHTAAVEPCVPWSTRGPRRRHRTRVGQAGPVLTCASPSPSLHPKPGSLRGLGERSME